MSAQEHILQITLRLSNWNAFGFAIYSQQLTHVGPYSKVEHVNIHIYICMYIHVYIYILESSCALRAHLILLSACTPWTLATAYNTTKPWLRAGVGALCSGTWNQCRATFKLCRYDVFWSHQSTPRHVVLSQYTRWNIQWLHESVRYTRLLRVAAWHKLQNPEICWEIMKTGSGIS